MNEFLFALCCIEEAEAVMELLRGNMQTQIDSVKEKGSSVDEEQVRFCYQDFC